MSGLPPLGPGPFDVVGLGENSVDLLAVVQHFPVPNEKLEMQDLTTRVGGQVATAVVACARLGQRTRYIGSFGNDAHASLVQAALAGEGIDLSACRVVPASNRTALIVVDLVTGTRTVMWRRGVELDRPAMAVPDAVVSGARVLLVDATDPIAATTAAMQAGAARVPVVLDVDTVVEGLDRLLPHVDVIVAADGFAEAMTGERSRSDAMRVLFDAYRPALLIITLGADGAVAWDGARQWLSPGFEVPVVDTTGAGDAFRGGFISAWVEEGRSGGRPALRKLLEEANAVAALNCLALGAQGGLPTRAELNAFVTDRPRARSKGTRDVTRRSRPGQRVVGRTDGNRFTGR
ncbi:MAG: ribokinase [Acidobacteria bacterium]|nr:ribokinase [Acidobacteriota bacterium]